MFRLQLDFWGVRVDTIVSNERDFTHLNYYLALHKSAEGDAELEIRLTAAGGSQPFVVAAADESVEKVIEVRRPATEHDFNVYESYCVRPTRPTVLPPLFIEPLRTKYVGIHGAAVALPGESRALLILGASGSGKSTLLLRLLRAGWGFVSDDLVVLDRHTGEVARYLRPIGVRQPGSLAEDHAEAPMLMTTTGRTLMLSPLDAGFDVAPDRCAVVGVIRPDRPTNSAALKFVGAPDSTVRMNMGPELAPALESAVRESLLV